MNPNCRACKHPITNHTNKCCGLCHCGALVIDTGEERQNYTPKNFIPKSWDSKPRDNKFTQKRVEE